MLDYGLSSTISADDERQPLWKKQRKKRGFDDTETWALDSTIARFILPRLKRFKEVNVGMWYFPDIEKADEERTNEVLDKMIRAFEIISDHSDSFRYNDELFDEARQGIELFYKHYFNLWW